MELMINIKHLSYLFYFLFSFNAFSSDDIRLQLKKKLPDINIETYYYSIFVTFIFCNFMW